MNTRTAHIIQYGLRIFLMGFWLYVALDKLWDLEAFHRALLRQPFPNWWAGVLYWSLPLTELGIALLFLNPRFFLVSLSFPKPSSHQHHVTLSLSKGTPYLLSSILLLLFTLYIALGVAGLYAQRPCGCASVFSSLSWDMHLLTNILLLAISILGWYLTGPTTPMDARANSADVSGDGYPPLLIRLRIVRLTITLSFKRLFPRRFAPFPGRPVHAHNLIRAAAARQTGTSLY